MFITLLVLLGLRFFSGSSLRLLLYVVTLLFLKSNSPKDTNFIVEIKAVLSMHVYFEVVTAMNILNNSVENVIFIVKEKLSKMFVNLITS